MNAAVSSSARATSDIARVYREADRQATAAANWRTLAAMRLVYLADAPYVHTRRVVEHFAGKGHEVHVISFRPAEIPNATVHHVDGLERIGKARYIVHARRVKSMVHDLRPDILHALHLTSYGFLAGFTGWQPSIVSVWGTDVLEAPSLSPAHGWITRRALAQAGTITATGLRLAEATLPHAPPEKPVIVIPYGIDVDLFTPAPRQEHDRLTIGAVARLSPEKGLEYLLRAVALIRDRADAAYETPRVIDVVLAGDGPAREKLEWLTAELRLDNNVRFLGEVAHKEVPAVLQSLDIFAMPSTWEGFGVAALEASAMRLSVIASDIHGIPDVVRPDETGLLVPARDVNALVEAIVQLAGDGALRLRLGEAGRAFVERNYRWQDNIALMERLYEDVRRS
jgi:glycosyltransferase involved in cell wall biosynthesis